MASRNLLRWSEMAWPALAQRHDVLIIPIGSIEQHGPHLPLTSDTLTPVGLVERLAEVGDQEIVMGIPIDYTYAPESESYPGTISLAGATVSSMVADALVSYSRHDLALIVFLNGHLESVAFILEGIRLGSARLPLPRTVLLVNWWDLVSSQTLERVYPGTWPGWVSEHAAVIESSVMLALFPALVQLKALPAVETFQLPPFKRSPFDSAPKPESGSFATAVGSSAEIGAVMVDEVVSELRDLIYSELNRNP